MRFTRRGIADALVVISVLATAGCTGGSFPLPVPSAPGAPTAGSRSTPSVPPTATPRPREQLLRLPISEPSTIDPARAEERQEFPPRDVEIDVGYRVGQPIRFAQSPERKEGGSGNHDGEFLCRIPSCRGMLCIERTSGRAIAIG